MYRNINLPIGTVIDNQMAIQLCHQYDRIDLVDRIESNPDTYRSWIFDGVSGIPDKLLGWILFMDPTPITYECALPHDLGYAYGELGNREERKRVDRDFYQNLQIKAGVSRPMAGFMYAMVRLFGTERFNFSFSWGYANRNRNVLPPLIIS